MLPFTLERPATPELASRALVASATGTGLQGRLPSEFLAGGTTLLDLMKLEAMAPAHVVDVEAASLRSFRHFRDPGWPSARRLGLDG